MTDIKAAYAASANQTVTNLNSLATSSDWTAGWASAAIDNTSNLYLDYEISAKLTLAAAGLSAGQVRLYIVKMLDDSNWPSPFDGTEGTKTITDTEERDSITFLGALAETDTTASATPQLFCTVNEALRTNICPSKFVIFITHSTGANLASSGNQVTIKGKYQTG